MSRDFQKSQTTNETVKYAGIIKWDAVWHRLQMGFEMEDTNLESEKVDIYPSPPPVPLGQCNWSRMVLPVRTLNSQNLHVPHHFWTPFTDFWWLPRFDLHLSLCHIKLGIVLPQVLQPDLSVQHALTIHTWGLSYAKLTRNGKKGVKEGYNTLSQGWAW